MTTRHNVLVKTSLYSNISMSKLRMLYLDDFEINFRPDCLIMLNLIASILYKFVNFRLSYVFSVNVVLLVKINLIAVHLDTAQMVTRHRHDPTKKKQIIIKTPDAKVIKMYMLDTR